MGKYTPAMEEQRLLFNEWLRRTDVFDDVYDAESLVREEHSDGYYYKESLHQGDRLHPNKEGGRLLAEGFDLKQITGG